MRQGRFENSNPHIEAEDGPFVSFTDLLAGILFIFLILVAALMLMQRNNLELAKSEGSSTVNLKSLLISIIEERDRLKDENKEAATQIDALKRELDKQKSTSSSVSVLTATNSALTAKISSLTSQLKLKQTLDDETQQLEKAKSIF